MYEKAHWWSVPDTFPVSHLIIVSKKIDFFKHRNSIKSGNHTSDLDILCFRNEGKRGPIKEQIDNFTLDTNSLVGEHKEVSLHLTFLKTEVR